MYCDHVGKLLHLPIRHRVWYLVKSRSSRAGDREFGMYVPELWVEQRLSHLFPMREVERRVEREIGWLTSDNIVKTMVFITDHWFGVSFPRREVAEGLKTARKPNDG